VTLAPDPETKRKSFVNVQKKPLSECPQLKVIRIDGSIFFGAVNHVAEQLDQITKNYPEQAHILIVGGGIKLHRCRRMPNAQPGGPSPARERTPDLPQLPQREVVEVMKRGGCNKNIGEENVFHSKRQAIKSIVPRLDPERCRRCKVRIFYECAQMPGG